LEKEASKVEFSG
jgi:hypothetical protein